MDHIFNMDNPVWRAIGRLVDLVWINLLTLVCALPVVTAGASFAAMYDVLLRMAENEEGPLTSGFLRAFRKNFRPATKIWLIALALLAVYAYNLWLWFAGAMDGLGMLKNVSMALIVIILFLLIIMLHYSFCLTVRYENSLGGTLKNAALLMIGFFPRSFSMGVLSLFPLALTLISNYFFWLWFLYGFTFPCYLIARLMVRVFERIDERDEEAEVDTDEYAEIESGVSSEFAQAQIQQAMERKTGAEHAPEPEPKIIPDDGQTPQRDYGQTAEHADRQAAEREDR